MKEGAGYRQWDHFLFFLNIGVCVWRILNCSYEGLFLSQPNILSVSFTTILSHPPLCCSDWLRDIEERAKGSSAAEKRSETVLFSFYAHTLWILRLGRGKNASTQLTPLSGTSIAKPTEPPWSFRSIFNQELLIFCCGLNHTLLTVGVVVLLFSFWGNVLTGAGPEDPCLSGANRFAPLQV